MGAVRVPQKSLSTLQMPLPVMLLLLTSVNQLDSFQLQCLVAALMASEGGVKYLWL